MHVGFISLDYPSSTGGGGVGRQVQIIGQNLVRRGHRVTVIALAEAGQTEVIEDRGVRVYRIPQGTLHWYVYKTPGLGGLGTLAVRELEVGWAVYKQVRRLHNQHPFDLIEGIEWGTFWTALFLRDVPLIIRLHGEHYTFHKHTPGLPVTPSLRLARVLQRHAMRRARLLTSPSQAHAGEIVTELGPGHPPVKVIPNAAALPTLDAKQPTIDNGQRTKIILFVGRLERVKGVLNLLEAAPRVLKELPNTRFVLAGGNHPNLTQAVLNQKVRQLALNERVTFLGHLSRQELAGWYQQADLCVLPSYYETFGLGALEPMAFGVPVVASRVGGLAEVVVDGVTGFLVSPGNPQVLAEKMIHLLRDQALREKMGQAGREQACRYFNLDQVVDVTLQLYNRVLTKEVPDYEGEIHANFTLRSS